MQVYRIIDIAFEGPQRAAFKHTLKEAQDEAKKFPEDTRPDVRIQQMTVLNDVRSVVDYLNGKQPEPAPADVLRTWRLSPRGGLIELNADGTDTKA